MPIYRVWNIDWDTSDTVYWDDDEQVDHLDLLPEELLIEVDHECDIADMLAELSGFCVDGYEWELYDQLADWLRQGVDNLAD